MKKTKLKIKAIEELEEIAVEIPIVDEPKRTHVFAAKVLRQAINPQWIYCVAIEQDLGCIHVAIPRRMTNRLVGKNIQVESITDITGTSYRYVQGQPH
jgi:hypothetical protein